MVIGILLPLPAYPGTNDHVVLITIDGLAAFYLADLQAPLPALRKLAAEGASVVSLKYVDITCGMDHGAGYGTTDQTFDAQFRTAPRTARYYQPAHRPIPRESPGLDHS
jgi:hypothetical protein